MGRCFSPVSTVFLLYLAVVARLEDGEGLRLRGIDGVAVARLDHDPEQLERVGGTLKRRSRTSVAYLWRYRQRRVRGRRT